MQFMFKVTQTATYKVPRHKISSNRLEKPEIEPGTPGDKASDLFTTYFSVYEVY